MPIIFPICLNASLDPILVFTMARRQGGGLVQSHYQTLVRCCQVLFECGRLNSACAVGQNLHHSRVAIQRRRHKYLYVFVFLGDTLNKGGEVALQMKAWSEEVGDDHDALHTCLLYTSPSPRD